jgi:hypothetical protein
MEQRKRLCAILAISFAAFSCPPARAQFGGGAGTASDPYLISTAEHLKAMRTQPGKPGNPVHYRIQEDIDLEGVAMVPQGTPNRPLVVVIDGNGKTISHLKIASYLGDNVGLLGYADAEVRDLTLADVEIDVPQSKTVGPLAGRLGGKVERCFVRGGSVTGKDQVGGLIGDGAGLIYQCSTSCSVSGQKDVGGLLGLYRGDSGVSQCFSTSNVSGNGAVGGLIGCNEGPVRDCYATGAVQGNNAVGGLAGMTGLICNCYAANRVQGKSHYGGLTGGDAVCCSSFWDAQVSGPTLAPGGAGKTTDELRRGATFLGWGRGSAWTIDEGKDYPRLAWEKQPGTPLETRAFPESQGQGTAENPYLIRTVEELNAIGDFAAEWDRHYRLEADLDMAGLKDKFRIIGREEAAFTGVFDGNDHSISNFTYPFQENCVGLFGCTNQAIIRRLTLVNPRLEQGGSLYVLVAPLIGQQVEGTVEDCTVEGGAASARQRVAGLVGACYGGTIRRCSSTCEVSGWRDGRDIGGLLGLGSRCNIDNCYAGGKVHGYENVGGLIGRMEQGNMSHCLATGAVSTATNAGGLVGLAKKTLAFACFWDILTTGRTSSAVGTGLTTVELRKAATFIDAGWDFVGEHKNGSADTWSIDEGKDYPRFTPEPPVPPVPPEPPVPPVPPEPPTPPVPPKYAWADDFEDGESLPLWQAYEPTPEVARMQETHGRLEFQVPAAPEAKVSAAFLSSGWTLDCSQDFNVKVDFHFTAVDIGEAWVSIGVTPDAAVPVLRRMEWAAGCLDGEPVHRGDRADGLGFAIWWTARGCDNGTLYLSYDAAGDELYLSYNGYGPANAFRTVPGLLKGFWAGRPMHITLGGGSEVMALTGKEAWLDNFSVDTGSVIP